MCSSSQVRHPGDILLALGTSPHGRAPHLGDVPKPQPCCHFTLLLLRQELVLEPVAKLSKAENVRHANVLKQANNHHSTVLKQWRGLCRLLTSPRSAWADR